MSYWIPIETAPLDREIIVLTKNSNAFRASWQLIDQNIGAWHASSPDFYPECWTDGICWTENENQEPSDPPTHWMPMPELPVNTNAST